ncbi:MAG: YraN family protein [Alphaproteobacteria bacterium]|nr:YraN family protein [Alphaproteobacteria bacterium]
MGSKITSDVAGRAPGVSSKSLGDAAEERVLVWLRDRGWRLLQRHYRSPGRGGGEIDLVMLDPARVLVFVEVRQRSRANWGGALASVTRAKQRRIIWAARHFLHRWPGEPPACRFDVVALEPEGLRWIEGAFTL